MAISPDCRAVHSAMLVLHDFHRPEIYGPEFDPVRGLFTSALEGSLSDEQRANISARVKFEFLAPAADASRGEVGVDEFRRLYRPDRIADDGVDVHFPHRSVTDYRDQIVVTLPIQRISGPMSCSESKRGAHAVWPPSPLMRSVRNNPHVPRVWSRQANEPPARTAIPDTRPEFPLRPCVLPPPTRWPTAGTTP